MKKYRQERYANPVIREEIKRENLETFNEKYQNDSNFRSEKLAKQKVYDDLNKEKIRVRQAAYREARRVAKSAYVEVLK